MDLEPLFKRLMPNASKYWNISSVNSPISDGFEVRLRPRVTGAFYIAGKDLEGYDRNALVAWLYREIKATQCKLVDMLEETLDRPKKACPPGRCHYCGAPYGDRP